jgi:hypothetical protein
MDLGPTLPVRKQRSTSLRSRRTKFVLTSNQSNCQFRSSHHHLTPTPSHRRWNSIAFDPLNTIEMENHLPGLRHPKHHEQERGTWVHKYMKISAKPRRLFPSGTKREIYRSAHLPPSSASMSSCPLHSSAIITLKHIIPRQVQRIWTLPRLTDT